MRDLTVNDEACVCLIFMIIEVFFFLALAGYLSNVFPSEFGVRKPWHFPITEPLAAYKSYKRRSANGGVDPESEANVAGKVQVNEAEVQFEDADVKQERAKVVSGQFEKQDFPLIMANMRKVYAGRGGAGPKLAVKDVTLAIEKNTIFGLLGPNGAGKTTLISILTGLYEASTGSASIAGHDIQTQTNQVYKTIGVCPQVLSFYIV